MSLIFYSEQEDNNKEESINKYKDLFINYEQKLPTLEEALNQMFISAGADKIKSDKLIKDILLKCKETIDDNLDKIKEKYNKINKEDAYIICSYTCESEEQEYSPYRIMNQNLVSENRKNGLNNISRYLYILLNSLRKLSRYYPSKKNKYLYRCITKQVNILIDPKNKKSVSFIEGNEKTFWGFTSTSPNVKMTYNFLKEEKKIKSGTIFTLGGDIWGYDITLFNYFKEEEILLEPERKFIVDNVLPPVNEIINVNCRILKTPLILDNIEYNIINNNIEEENEDNISINDYNIKKGIVKIEMEIKINDKYKYISGIGLLCNIKSKNMKVFITYNHIIDIEFLNNEKKLIFFNDNEKIEINMEINRYKNTNKELDYTIIEILEEDNINNYLEIDDYINSKDYKDEEIILINLYRGKKLEYSKGKIIERKNNYIICSIKQYNEGIIILMDNLKLIGLIKENKDNKDIICIPMNIIINKINYIKCIYEIKKEEIGKEIQILNNGYYWDKFIKKNDEIEKEIKVIINGEIKENIFKYKFHRCFIIVLH